jgi:hypothetical protein
VESVNTFARLSVNIAGLAAVHAAVPAFFTVIVYVTLSPGLAVCSEGTLVTVKAHCDEVGRIVNAAVPDDVPAGASVTPLVPVVATLPVFDTVIAAVGHVFTTVVWKQVWMGPPTHESVTVAAFTTVGLVTPVRVTWAVSDAVLPDTGSEARFKLVWPGASCRLV